MNKKTLLLAVVLTAVLLFVSLPAVSAEPGAIQCDLDITHDYHDGEDMPPYWLGTVIGPDCTVAGEIEFRAVPEEYFTSGKTIHFVETFVIRPYDGGELYGKNYGVWNLSTFKYRANGWVLNATPEWEQMIGYKYHESGTTSDPADAPPIYAPGGWAILVPANRAP
jgi:hypothetical protein